MKSWKKIVLGTLLAGFVSCGTIYAQVSIRNGPVGDSKQELVRKALMDVLNTNGTLNTVTNYGVFTTGIGTKNSGYVISDSVEYLSTGTGVGTLTTLAVNGSETVYIEADVIGQAGTSTERVVAKIIGAFDRDGSAALGAEGTATYKVVVNRTGMKGEPVYFSAGSNNSIQLNVKSSVAKKVQWAGVIKYMKVTTTGAE